MTEGIQQRRNTTTVTNMMRPDLRSLLRSTARRSLEAAMMRLLGEAQVTQSLALVSMSPSVLSLVIAFFW